MSYIRANRYPLTPKPNGSPDAQPKDHTPVSCLLKTTEKKMRMFVVLRVGVGGGGGHDRHSDGTSTVRIVWSGAGETSRGRVRTSTPPVWGNFWTGRWVFPSLGRTGILLDP